MIKTSAVSRAVDLAGGQNALSRLIGVSQSTVSGWIKDGRCGPTHAIAIHKALKGKVSAHDLRPDLYPRRLVAFK